MAGARVVILNTLTPVQRVAQKIGNPEPRISTEFVHEVWDDVQDGDVFLTREEWRLTNPFVPGFWGHAAIYHKGWVIEAIGDYKGRDGKVYNGVRKEDLFRFLYQKDHVAHLRFQASADDRSRIGEVAMNQLGKKYDYGFKPGAEFFYCSELIVFAHNTVFPNSKIYLKDQFGVETSTPQDLYDDKHGRFLLLREEINNA